MRNSLLTNSHGFVLKTVAILAISFCAIPTTASTIDHDWNKSEGRREYVEEWLPNSRVFFSRNSARLSSAAKEALDRQAALLQKHPQIRIVVQGHCDNYGPRAYNFDLGERRASAAKKYLVARGIEEKRVTTISWGEDRSFGRDKTSRAFNRAASSEVIVP